jgi:hypothetical protein
MRRPIGKGVKIGPQGGAQGPTRPMQYKAIGPEILGPQNIQKFDQQWNASPVMNEALNLKIRQMLFPGATTPGSLELPSEKADRLFEFMYLSE